MRLNLTQAVVNAIEPPETGRLAIYDAKQPGLVLRVTPAGAKSWCLYRRVNGKPQRISLGTFPAIGVEDARKLAAMHLANIYKGVDPNAEKRASRRNTTLGEAWKAFHENRTTARGTFLTAKSHKSRYLTCLAHWSDRKLTSISHDDVTALHVRLGRERGHVTANRAVQLLRAIINHAKLDGNPASKIELFRETARERFLRADELPKFWKALQAEPDPTFRDFFGLCLWTGARKGNVQAMRWADVHLEDAEWIIPAEAFKTRRQHVVILSDQAVEILKRRRRENPFGEFVFPSYGKTRHLAEPKTAWARLLRRAGLADLRIHDLRRTLGSWQARLGASLPIIGKSLGHLRPETTAIYSRLQTDVVRDSVTAATAAIEQAAKPKRKAKGKIGKTG